jgi:hypothetical protein
MKHLESKREAVERRRLSLMNTGVARFLERTSKQPNGPGIGLNSDQAGSTSTVNDSEARHSSVDLSATTSQTSASDNNQDGWQGKKEPSQIVSDMIKMTLDHAAKILRETLELTAGGVLFLDTTNGLRTPTQYVDNVGFKNDPDGLTREFETTQVGPSSADPLSSPDADLTQRGIDPENITPSNFKKPQPPKFQEESRTTRPPTLSCSKHAYLRSGIFDSETLSKFVNMYPKGNVWYIDGTGFFSSLDQTDAMNNNVAKAGTSKMRGALETIDVDVVRHEAEVAVLSKAFYKARQIIFLPLWDAGARK